MHPTARRVCVLIASVLFAVSTASAQSSAYVGATAFADIRQFGSTTSDSFYRSGDDFSLDATAAGGGLRIGTRLHPKWTLELGVDVGPRKTVDVEDPIVILIFPPLPRLDLKASTSFVTVSTMVGFHPPALGRVRLGYLAGFSFVRATYRSDYPDFAVPLAIFSGPGSPSTRITIFPPPRFSRTTLTQKHNTGALALGFEAAIDLSTNVAVVPEFRALAFSAPANGPGVFLIRPGVGLRWSF